MVMKLLTFSLLVIWVTISAQDSSVTPLRNPINQECQDGGPSVDDASCPSNAQQKRSIIDGLPLIGGLLDGKHVQKANDRIPTTSEWTEIASSDSSKHMSDVVIIGQGMAGLTIANTLCQKGLSVTLIDKSTPGNPESSSIGHTWLIVEVLSQLGQTFGTQEGMKVWREVEKSTGYEFVHDETVLYVVQDESQEMHDIVKEAKVNNIPINLLDNNGVNKKYPGMIIPLGFIGIEVPASKMHCPTALAALMKMVVQNGGKIVQNDPVTEIHETEKFGRTCFRLMTSSGHEIFTHNVVMAVGAGTDDMVVARKDGSEFVLKNPAKLLECTMCRYKLAEGMKFEPALYIMAKHSDANTYVETPVDYQNQWRVYDYIGQPTSANDRSYAPNNAKMTGYETLLEKRYVQPFERVACTTFTSPQTPLKGPLVGPVPQVSGMYQVVLHGESSLGLIPIVGLIFYKLLKYGECMEKYKELVNYCQLN